MYECFNEFPKKELRVVDLIHYLSNKEEVVIVIDNDWDMPDIVFDGRVEDLMYTSEGCLHSAALYKIHSVEVSSDNKLLITIDDLGLWDN